MDLMQMIRDKRILLVAHRGVCGANIPCNSMAAFRAAVHHGADIVELDVERSLDGELFIQHPGMESVHLRLKDSIKNYPASVVENFVLSNSESVRTEHKIARLEQALTYLRGKCIVNIDKFWENPEKIAALVRKLGMENDVIIKTANKPQYLDDVEKYAPDIPFMTIATTEDTTHEMLMKRNIRYIGTEVLFDREDAPVASKEYIDRMHADGKIVWVNSIVYNYKAVLSAGHNDDIAIERDPEYGWGWLADRGFDLIQTDFIFPCRTFLEATGRRNK